MRFVTSDPRREVLVEIDQDAQDVNLMVNGIVVGWFDGGMSCLYMRTLDTCEAKALQDAGVEVVDGEIHVCRGASG